MVLGLISLLDGSPWEIPVRRDLLSQQGAHWCIPTRSYGGCGCGPWGGTAHSVRSLTEVVETILQSRAPSTRKLYALNGNFSLHGAEIASSTQLTPGWYSAGGSCRFDSPQGCNHSTLKVYVAAISAYHASLGGQSVGRTPLCDTFPPWCTEAKASSTVRIPPWDLAVCVRCSL